MYEVIAREKVGRVLVTLAAAYPFLRMRTDKLLSIVGPPLHCFGKTWKMLKYPFDNIWLWCSSGCGLVIFVLRYLGRIDHLVIFSRVAALVAAGRTFVAAVAGGAALCVWRIGIRVLVFVCLLIGLGFVFMISPSVFLVIMLSFGLACNLFSYLMKRYFSTKKKKKEIIL